jgi:acyl-CoA reductase-like NAD-dependent aldehyde dehydrogenase
MFPFVASQAIALSRAKQKASKAPASGQRSATPRSRKGFLSRLFDALAESRARQAAMELQRQRRLRGEALEK